MPRLQYLTNAFAPKVIIPPTKGLRLMRMALGVVQKYHNDLGNMKNSLVKGDFVFCNDTSLNCMFCN